jgi:hypothetical protein
MTATIIPNHHSNVIYLQNSFHFPECPFPGTIFQLPFAKVALNFPWEAVFSSYEQEFLQTRLDLHSKNSAESEEELKEPTLFDLPSSTPDSKKRSPQGRKGIGFYPLLKAFLLAPLLHIEVMVSTVHAQVEANPAFAALCGFSSIPSIRTFERFDQIMIETGLWEKARKVTVCHNFEQGVIEKEAVIAVDTSHIEAEATLNATQKTCDHPKPCECLKVPTDDNVGLVRKSNTVSYIGHRASVVCGVNSELPLSRTIFKGNQSDAVTLEETLKDVLEDVPFLTNSIRYVTADGVYQSENNQTLCKEILDAKLIAPINPRNRKEKPIDVRGMQKITSYGVPVCKSGHQMKLKGLDSTNNQYIWVCPVFNGKYQEKGLTCSTTCHTECCSQAKTGRTIRIDQETTPQIDPEFPQHLVSFQKIYKERTAIERVFAQLKDGLSMRRVHKRGKKAVEAHMDRCITISHMLAYISVMETGALYRGWTKLSA